MTTSQTTPRLDLTRNARAAFAAMVRVEERIDLDAPLRRLIQVRASQLNGCARCIDMHWAEARAGGESEVRLAQVGAWHESPFFDERERAALALTDAMTHIAGTHVPDDVWADAAAEFDAEELAQLVFAIAAINCWNRLMVATRATPASYVRQSVGAVA
jgi:AhpD family alkylhydroperoxidase